MTNKYGDEMATKLSYYEDTYRFEDRAIINATGIDEIGHFILLDQTIFYPQGGGQPSDTGTVKANDILIPIHFVKSIDDEVRHYTEKDYSNCVGVEALCSINPEARIKHAKLHTSGHLISTVVEKLYPQLQAIKGHHFPDQCYVEFSSCSDYLDDFSLQLVQNELEKIIQQDCTTSNIEVSGAQLKELCPNLPYSIPSNKQMRVTRIGDFPYTPCGGTHVKSLKELEGLEITKHKIKGKSLKISYRI